MKLLLAAILLVNTGLVLAGETCYKVTSETPANVPQTFCLDSLALDVDSGILRIQGTDSSLPKIFNNSSVVRNLDETYSFASYKTIYDFNETVCGESIQAVAVIKGQSDGYGSVQADKLSISVEYETLRDSCHSYPILETFEYKLVK